MTHAVPRPGPRPPRTTVETRLPDKTPMFVAPSLSPKFSCVEPKFFV